MTHYFKNSADLSASPVRLHLCIPGREHALRQELGRVLPLSQHRVIAPSLLESLIAPEEAGLTPSLAFAAQTLPHARFLEAPSISLWARETAPGIIEGLCGHQGPWRLHVFSISSIAFRPETYRCRLIEEALVQLLKRKQRRLLRTRVTDFSTPLQPDEALVQAALQAPDTGFISVCMPEEQFLLRRCMSRFPAGLVSVPADKKPPSRAYQKLCEVELRLGRRIQEGETCVDLGASPGGWSFIALQRGAAVQAVDRSPLRKDCITHPNLTFIKGSAFSFEPGKPVDWLLCDVISFPDKTLDLLKLWISKRLCRFFCVTIKFKGEEHYPVIEDIKKFLEHSSAEFYLRQLTHNKNEVTAFGEIS